VAYIANYAKGSIGYYWQQAQDTAADIGVLLLQGAGLEAEDALKDYQTIAALLAGTSDEATFTGYTRKTFPSPTQSVDTATNQLVLASAQAPPITLIWPPAPAGQTLSKVVLYYDPSPGTSTDVQKIHLWGASINIVTDGSQPTVSFGASGIAIAKDGA
jgi:hypothetical protein